MLFRKRTNRNQEYQGEKATSSNHDNQQLENEKKANLGISAGTIPETGEVPTDIEGQTAQAFESSE